VVRFKYGCGHLHRSKKFSQSWQRIILEGRVVADRVEIAVVGMLYRNTPATLKKLVEAAPLQCKLEREPDNPADRNAVKVIVVEKPWKNTHVGYVARIVAAKIAPRMDSGNFAWTDVWLVEIDDEAGTGELLLRKRAKAKSK
jgi:hypothetical protein